MRLTAASGGERASSTTQSLGCCAVSSKWGKIDHLGWSVVADVRLLRLHRLLPSSTSCLAALMVTPPLLLLRLLLRLLVLQRDRRAVKDIAGIEEVSMEIRRSEEAGEGAVLYLLGACPAHAQIARTAAAKQRSGATGRTATGRHRKPGVLSSSVSFVTAHRRISLAAR